ncbi:MAG: glycosyltransferase, partial [Alphaproteobacteria bacterium]|nr:glycosyltransferase [Alphaproteobacteria bacterium]
SLFRTLNPEVDIRVYIHSHPLGERDLRADLDELGLDRLVVFPEPYIMTQGGFSEEQMVKIFNCADLVLNVCMEGFGLPQSQAQACGVPVVILSEGAGPEITVFGWETTPMATEVSAHQMAQPIPSPPAIAQCLGEYWKLRTERGAPLRSERAIQFVKDNLSWDYIAEQWFEVIERIMQDKEKYCWDIPKPAEWLKEKMEQEVVLD